jgi:hypothetical protein
VDILHHHLKAVETTRLGYLYLGAKPLGKIFKYDSITSSEESKHMLNEVLLVFGEFWPVSLVATEVYLIDSPEACHLVFVHLPDVFVLDGQDDEAVWVFF